jgi:hypothetical protein
MATKRIVAQPENNGDGIGDFDPAELEQQPLPPTDSGPDPFDPASLRLSETFSASVGVKKALLTVPVDKPRNSWFVRTHPDPAFRLQTAMIELKEDREDYLVAQPLWSELSTEVTFKPKLLITAVNKQGVLFLWKANLPRPDGRTDEWSRTALEAISLAEKNWIRIAANMALGAYEVAVATGQLAEPIWPELSFAQILKIAFKDKFINDPAHPVLRRLRGEV